MLGGTKLVNMVFSEQVCVKCTIIIEIYNSIKMNKGKPTLAPSEFLSHIVFHRTMCLVLSPVIKRRPSYLIPCSGRDKNYF